MGSFETTDFSDSFVGELALEISLGALRPIRFPILTGPSRSHHCRYYPNSSIDDCDIRSVDVRFPPREDAVNSLVEDRPCQLYSIQYPFETSVTSYLCVPAPLRDHSHRPHFFKNSCLFQSERGVSLVLYWYVDD